MDEQRQDVPLETIYSSSVPIRDVALKICRKQWTIGWCGKRGSGISVRDIIIIIIINYLKPYNCVQRNDSLNRNNFLKSYD